MFSAISVCFFNATATTEIYTLSLHDALPISAPIPELAPVTTTTRPRMAAAHYRSEEHTSELQSQSNLVCRLLLEKKKRKLLYSNEMRLILSHYLISYTVEQLQHELALLDPFI